MVTEYLLTGAENAKTGRELARLLHCDIRDITKSIERERRAGAPIVSSYGGEHPGYYLAESAEELQTYCRCLHQRAGEIFKTRRALLETAADMQQES